MKIYRGVDTSQQTPSSTTTIGGEGADLQVPNPERLSFRGLANNHQYILQSRLFSGGSPSPPPPPSPSSEWYKMSPTTTQTQSHPVPTNGLKIVGGVSSSSTNSHPTFSCSPAQGGNGFHSYLPCGDGDMCEWDWSMGSLSLHNNSSSSATPTTEPSMSEWFSGSGNSAHANKLQKPLTKSTSTSTTSLYLSCNGDANVNGHVNGHQVNACQDVNGNFNLSQKHQTESPLSKMHNRPMSLDLLNQNGQNNNDHAEEMLSSLRSYQNGHQNNFDSSPEEDENSSKSNEEDKDAKRARSSSLKTTKTPPGTPGHKKIVRFADCLGLDLVDVKLFLDEIPNVPKSAFSDLQDAIDRREEELFVQKKNKANKLDRTLLPSFHQPVEMGDFFDRVDAQKVLLENCYLLDSHQIKGCVRVKNLDFNKSVFLRFTYDDWETFGEIETNYVPGSCDGFSDRFEFNLMVDSSRTRIGTKFAFACRYECLKQEFWDNNCNRNYVFHCVPSN